MLEKVLAKLNSGGMTAYSGEKSDPRLAQVIVQPPMNMDWKHFVEIVRLFNEGIAQLKAAKGDGSYLILHLVELDKEQEYVRVLFEWLKPKKANA